MLSACFFMLTEAQTVHLEQIIKPTWPLEMTSAIKLLYSSNSPIIVTSTFTIIKMMIRIGHFYYYCITVWALVITAFVNCPSLCLSCPLAFIFSLKSAYIPPPPALHPSLRVYPDISPIKPVASDGTRVTVQTRGSSWLATVLAQTQSSLGIDEGTGSVLVYVCVGVTRGGVQTGRSPVSHKHTHTPLEQKQYCLNRQLWWHIQA